jgi:hypothetical protein
MVQTPRIFDRINEEWSNGDMVESVMLTGHVSSVQPVRQTDNGTVLNISVAYTEVTFDDGERRYESGYADVAAWGANWVEALKDEMLIGTPVLVKGNVTGEYNGNMQINAETLTRVISRDEEMVLRAYRELLKVSGQVTDRDGNTVAPRGEYNDEQVDAMDYALNILDAVAERARDRTIDRTEKSRNRLKRRDSNSTSNSSSKKRNERKDPF